MISKSVIETVNSNPALMSALYDMNLMPEQAVTDDRIRALTLFTAGFALGQASPTPTINLLHLPKTGS